MPDKQPNLWYVRLCIVLGWATGLAWIAFALIAGALTWATAAIGLVLFLGFRGLGSVLIYIVHGPNE